MCWVSCWPRGVSSTWGTSASGPAGCSRATSRRSWRAISPGTRRGPVDGRQRRAARQREATGKDPALPRRPRASPVDDRAVVRVVGLGVLPIVADLGRHRLLVELDPQPRSGGDLDEAVHHLEGLLQIAFAERHLLLAE